MFCAGTWKHSVQRIISVQPTAVLKANVLALQQQLHLALSHLPHSRLPPPQPLFRPRLSSLSLRPLLCPTLAAEQEKLALQPQLQILQQLGLLLLDTLPQLLFRAARQLQFWSTALDPLQILLRAQLQAQVLQAPFK